MSPLLYHWATPPEKRLRYWAQIISASTTPRKRVLFWRQRWIFDRSCVAYADAPPITTLGITWNG